nr:DEAD/DEAH box helicase [Luteimicrobium subarcticum]
MTVDAAETLDVPATDEAPTQTFADFGVRPEIAGSLADAGIVHPFPIQAMTLPVAMARHDIIGQAKTGTGKTFGFGVPLLEHVVSPGEPGWDTKPDAGKPQAIVVVPTRELAVQVAGDLQKASTRRSVRVLQLYGGRAYEPQIEALQRGVEVVVGTPGRVVDLIKQRHLDLSRATTVVLDEADEMLDLGFLPDVERIISATPANRHTMLFSATMPGAVVAMARRYMTQPTHIRANDPDDAGATVKNIKQVVYRAHALDKVEMLARILQADQRGLTIVFTRTKRTAAKVSDELVERGFAAAAIHGDLGQGSREQALRAFRSGKVDVLVATDVAARGIDVDDVTHVVNYQCPEDEKTYLHRTGRTGRAGNRGTAVTFVDWDDVPRWSLIDKALGLGVPAPVETYSSSEHLYTDLDIPAGTKGRLPKAQQVRAGLDAERLEDLGETGKRTSGRPSGSRSGHDGGPSGGGRSGGTRSGGGRSSGTRSGGDRDGSHQHPQTRPATGGDGHSGTTQDAGAAPTTSAAGEQAPARRRRRRRRSGGAGGGATDGAQGTSEA